MKVIKVKNYDEMSKKAAAILAAQVIAKPDSVLGLATGSTPEGTYKYLVDMYNQGMLDFSEITTVNLDEYKGISKDNDQSYYYFMNKHLFKHVNIKPENTYIPDGESEDADKNCADYEALIKELGGADIQLLGIGRNGHIGFNEPGDTFKEATHCVTLTESTIEANKRFFEKEEDVPRQAYSQGIGTIMSAKKILLVASGEDKAEAVYQMIYGDISPKVQATVLRLHQDVIVIADEAAFSVIDKKVK